MKDAYDFKNAVRGAVISDRIQKSLVSLRDRNDVLAKAMSKKDAKELKAKHHEAAQHHAIQAILRYRAAEKLQKQISDLEDKVREKYEDEHRGNTDYDEVRDLQKEATKDLREKATAQSEAANRHRDIQTRHMARAGFSGRNNSPELREIDSGRRDEEDKHTKGKKLQAQHEMDAALPDKQSHLDAMQHHLAMAKKRGSTSNDIAYHKKLYEHHGHMLGQSSYDARWPRKLDKTRETYDRENRDHPADKHLVSTNTEGEYNSHITPKDFISHLKSQPEDEQVRQLTHPFMDIEDKAKFLANRPQLIERLTGRRRSRYHGNETDIMDDPRLLSAIVAEKPHPEVAEMLLSRLGRKLKTKDAKALAESEDPETRAKTYLNSKIDPKDVTGLLEKERAEANAPEGTPHAFGALVHNIVHNPPPAYSDEDHIRLIDELRNKKGFTPEERASTLRSIYKGGSDRVKNHLLQNETQDVHPALDQGWHGRDANYFVSGDTKKHLLNHADPKVRQSAYGSLQMSPGEQKEAVEREMRGDAHPELLGKIGEFKDVDDATRKKAFTHFAKQADPGNKKDRWSRKENRAEELASAVSRLKDWSGGGDEFKRHVVQKHPEWADNSDVAEFGHELTPQKLAQIADSKEDMGARRDAVRDFLHNEKLTPEHIGALDTMLSQYGQSPEDLVIQRGRMVGHPNVPRDVMEKYRESHPGAVIQNPNHTKEDYEAIKAKHADNPDAWMESHHLTPEDAKSLLEHQPEPGEYPSKRVKERATHWGRDRMVEKPMDESDQAKYRKQLQADFQQKLIQNPNVPSDVVSKVIDSLPAGAINKYLESDKAPKDVLEHIRQKYLKRPSSVPARLMQSPHFTKEELKPFLKPGMRKEAAFAYANRPDADVSEISPYVQIDPEKEDLNKLPPKFLRELKLHPKDLVIPHEGLEHKFSHAPDPLVSQSVADLIEGGPESGMTWGELKKKRPDVERNPTIRGIFTKYGNKPVTKEAFQQELSALPKKDWHVSWRNWEGMQRHSKDPQLVVQLNSSNEMEKKIAEDPARHKTFQQLFDASHRSGHPTLPHTMGWGRVDTSDPKHWFVDEIQSDVPVLNHDERKEIGPEKTKHVEDLHGLLGGWEESMLHNIMQTAKKHGVERVSIHSPESKAKMNLGEGQQVPGKYKEIYGKMPSRAGFERSTAGEHGLHERSHELKAESPIYTKSLVPEAAKTLTLPSPGESEAPKPVKKAEEWADRFLDSTLEGESV